MRVPLSAPVLALLIGVAATTTAQSGRFDYPQWRGLHRDGGASGFVEPSAWPAALTRQWTVPVGEGYATPLVIGDRVFVFTRRNDDEMLTALDAGTGSVHWQTTYAAPYDMFTATTVHGPGPKATPLFVDDKLFTLGISGIVSAFDADSGRLLWQKPGPSEQPFYGTASSPAADGDLVFVHTGNNDALTAFDVGAGAVVWNDDVSTALANPVVVADTLFGLSERRRGQFFALDADTGATLWLGPPRQAENTAVVKTERLLFLLNDDAEMIVARASRTGFEPIARYTVADSATWAQPAISGNRFFVKDVDSLTLWTMTSAAP